MPKVTQLLSGAAEIHTHAVFPRAPAFNDYAVLPVGLIIIDVNILQLYDENLGHFESRKLEVR